MLAGAGNLRLQSDIGVRDVDDSRIENFGLWSSYVDGIRNIDVNARIDVGFRNVGLWSPHVDGIRNNDVNVRIDVGFRNVDKLKVIE